jgi:non-homologous end joining protein Ku
MEDRYAERLRDMVKRKRAEGKDVVELPTEIEAERDGAEIIDLMAMLERSLKQGAPRRRTARPRASKRAKAS